GFAVLLQQTLVERARVHTDTQRDICILGGFGDGTDLVIDFADVARVDSHGSTARINSGKNVLRLEVNIGDDWDLGFAGDLGQRISIVLARASHPNDVTSSSRELG